MTDGLISALRTVLPPDIHMNAQDPSAPALGLFPDESIHVSNAIDARKREFAAGRRAARAALTAAGANPASIPANPDRAPAWPTGSTGSISHCKNACLAIATTAPKYQGIGIDIEPDSPLDADLIPEILTAQEIENCADPANIAKSIFCAKEAAYKAQYALSGQMIGFHDLTVALSKNDASFVAQLENNTSTLAAGTRIHGRILNAAGYVVAFAVIGA